MKLHSFFRASVSVATSILIAGSAWAQSQTPWADLWTVDGGIAGGSLVGDIQSAGGLVYVGGDFSYVGPNAPFAAVLDKTTGEVLRTLQLNGVPSECVADGQGGWFVIGAKSASGEMEFSGPLHHFFADGSIDPAFDHEFTASSGFGSLGALVVSDETLYVGGRFDFVNGEGHLNLAAFDIPTGNLLPWSGNVSINGAGGQVNALRVYENLLLIGGNFNRANINAGRIHLAALDGVTGGLGDLSVGMNSQIYSMEVSGETVLVGGNFTAAGLVARNRLAAIDIATSQTLPWNPNSNGIVDEILFDGNHIYVGGRFDTIGGQPRRSYAQLDLTTGQATDWDMSVGAGGGNGWSLVADGNTLFAGGVFREISGAPATFLARLDIPTESVITPSMNAGASVVDLALQNDELLAIGFFNTLGPDMIERDGLAAFDPMTGEVTDWAPEVTNTSSRLISDFDIVGDTVYIAGRFDNVGGQPRSRLAAVSATTGEPTAWAPMVSGGGFEVLQLEVGSDAVYIAGAFLQINGEDRTRLGAVDFSGQTTAWDPAGTFSGSVAPSGGLVLDIDAITLSDDSAFLGGLFSTMGGEMRQNIAEVNLTDGAATTWNPGANNLVTQILLSDSHVYAVGGFTNVGGQDRFNLAQLDLTTGMATAWDPNPDFGPITAVDYALGQVYVAGAFRNIGGADRFRLAILDATTAAAAAPWNPGGEGPENYMLPAFNKIEVVGTSVYVGGQFTGIGATTRPAFAAFRGAPPVDVTPGQVINFLLDTGDLTPEEMMAADANQDGILNVADPVTLINLENQ